jgi:hypothetical protein
MVLLLASGATAQRVVDEATLVDANGKQIGTLHVDFKGGTSVLIELDDHSIVNVQAHPGGFQGEFQFVYYATADCSGQAYGDTFSVLNYQQSLVPNAFPLCQ